MSTTLDYYNENAASFVSGTVDVEFSVIQDKFRSLLPAGSYILDFGCGSGRDTKYFLDLGYRVDATDKYHSTLYIEGFSQMMKDPSYCYKFYWLEAIVQLIAEGKQQTTFDEIICPNGILSLRGLQITSS